LPTTAVPLLTEGEPAATAQAVVMIKLQRLPGKPFTTRIKSRPVRGYFTLCLPGSPKVNAGGAYGAWLPGRELLRISASTTASLGPSSAV
jgi:hypothetical protein